MATYPVSYRPEYIEKRNRLTTFFRFLLAIPLMIVGVLYGIAAIFTVIAAWFALLFTARYPEGLWRFNSGVFRFWARVTGYLYLQADPYPPFDTGEHPEYPIRVVFDPPQASYSRVKVFFRIILAIPVYIVLQVFGYLVMAVAFVMWLVAVLLGKMPRGLFDVMTFLQGFSVRTTGYMVFLFTDKYPTFSDEGASSGPGPGHLPAGYGPPPGQGPASAYGQPAAQPYGAPPAPPVEGQQPGVSPVP